MRRLVAALCMVLALSGCSGGFPRDPQGTLPRVSDGTLRVGVSERDPYTRVEDDGGVTGTEATLVQGYATSIGAQVEWVRGSTSELMVQLSNGDVDLVIGGLREDTPVTRGATLTRPYAREVTSSGTRFGLVLAAPAGENAFLTSVETYLIQHGSFS